MIVKENGVKNLAILAIVGIVLLAANFVLWSRLNGPAAIQIEPETVDERTDIFQDVTASSGVSFTYQNGEEADQFTILESLGGGVALLDYDNDGLLDIFVTGGGFFQGEEIHGHPCRLYKNLGNFRFKDVTSEVMPDQALFYTHGCAVADYNRDGWPDLLGKADVFDGAQLKSDLYWRIQEGEGRATPLFSPDPAR